MSKTSIEWTEHRWNPVVGCSVKSPGCINCYAMPLAHRLGAITTTAHYAGLTETSKAGPVFTGKVAKAPEKTLLEPLRRKAPTIYFVNSMGDLFHENVPDEWIDRVFAVMALCPQHTFQVLTKRAERMRNYLHGGDGRRTSVWSRIYRAAVALAPDCKCNSHLGYLLAGWGTEPRAIPNVWLGVSTERQQEADELIPLLLQTPAAIRFVSCEPLLGPIDLTRIAYAKGKTLDALGGGRFREGEWNGIGRVLDWVIVGGESGHHARPLDFKDAIPIKNLCEMAGVPFFFKQWGEWWHERQQLPAPIPPEILARCRKVTWSDGSVSYRVGKKKAGRYLDGQLHDAMPEVRL